MTEQHTDTPTVTVFNGYRLLRGLGQGNTSRVYLAEKLSDESVGSPASSPASSPAARTSPDGRAGTRVALKLPLQSTLKDKGAAERFGNEVRLTLQFSHPRLVAGLGGTPFGEGSFLAMRHYEGATLSRRMSAGASGAQMSLRGQLQVLSDVASGLAYLHSAGAVHQDVKTQNVYLEQWEEGERYRAALGDFGSTYFLAQRGQVAGSPFYMAPEIYRSEPGGTASDVYSFGVMAYELLSGQRPHLGNSYEQLMVSHLTHFPAPLQRAGLDRSAAKLLDAALAKRVADRPVAAELRRALLSNLGQPDGNGQQEAPAALPVPAAPTRNATGRHGQDTGVSRQTPAHLVFGQTPAKEAPPTKTPAPPEKRGWNPFQKKR